MTTFSSRRVWFMHIPKTAGTSIHHALAPHLGPCLFYHPLASEAQETKFGRRYGNFRARVERLDRVSAEALISELDEQQFIGGHTDSSILGHLSADRFRLTALRDPLDRLVSYYFHAVHPESSDHKRRYSEQTDGMDFPAFLEFEPLRHATDNLLCRFLIGDRHKPKLDEDDLAQALSQLSAFDFICFQDQLADDLKHVATMLDIPPSAFDPAIRLKVSRKRKRARMETPDREDERIALAVRFDDIIYEEAKKNRLRARHRQSAIVANHAADT